MSSYKDIELHNTLEKLPRRACIVFSLWCCRQVQDKVPDNEKSSYVKLIPLIEKWLDGEATSEECCLA